MAEMPGWEESEQGSSKTLPIVGILSLGIQGRRSNRAVGAWSFRNLPNWAFISMTQEHWNLLIPARCHINVVPLMYVNEASDRLSGGKI